MAWKFDFKEVDLVWIQPVADIVDNASIAMGDYGSSDLTVDTGDRTNDTSVVDQGDRIIDGNI